jgi:hypothetical protein
VKCRAFREGAGWERAVWARAGNDETTNNKARREGRGMTDPFDIDRWRNDHFLKCSMTGKRPTDVLGGTIVK